LVFLRSDVDGLLVTIYLTEGERRFRIETKFYNRMELGVRISFRKISRLERKQELGKVKAC